MDSAAGIGFVCCVESGYLESQTVRMVESLRKYGGRFANAPVVAVSPRSGPPLSKVSRALLKSHGVDHISRRGVDQYAWFNFYNKPLALVYAEEHLQTELVGFLDSDLLIVNEPEKLQIAADEDFLAFPVECKEMGTTGSAGPYEELWRASCKVAGVELDTLPWVVTAQTHERIRLYFNSGIFVYRRACGFAKEYLRLCRALLDSRVGTRAEGYGLGFKEQVSMALAVMTLGLRWRSLPYSHNYPMSTATHDHWYDLENLRNARVVHYHDAMWPGFWATFLRCMQAAHPDVANWLSALGPMKNDAPAPSRLVSRFLRTARTWQAKRYLDSCTMY